MNNPTLELAVAGGLFLALIMAVGVLIGAGEIDR